MDAVEGAAEALGRGDLLAAYDLAHRPAEIAGVPIRQRYLEVLALARMGSNAEALRLYRLYGLAAQSDIDSRSLLARLLKDHAFCETGEARTAALRQAGQAYRDVWETTGDSFPGINAATLAFAFGEQEAARRLAEQVLAVLPRAPEDYYDAASRAEGLLLLGRESEVAPALNEALALPGADHGAISTTRLQFERLGEAMGLTKDRLAELLLPLRLPTVAMFCGHIFRPDPARETELARHIDEALARENIAIAYGALAAGADILMAERVLAAGGDLHVMLPFAESDFIEQSVRPAGDRWLARYDSIRTRATSFGTATHAGYVGDPAQFAYGSCVKMGLVRMRGRHLHTDCVQLALWDGMPGDRAGTGFAVEHWTNTGGRTVVIDGGGLVRPGEQRNGTSGASRRALRSLLFADFPRFSAIPEGCLPDFWTHVMRVSAGVLDGFGDDLEFCNSWGDAIFAVFSDVASAAEAALAMQHALRAVDAESIGLTPPLQMRVSLHHGPIYTGRDPLTGRGCYYGTEVSRAARVEPMTPPGSVYVSEPFAAMLSLEAADRFSPNYVGRLDLPKGFGEFPIYSVETCTDEPT